LGIIIYEMFTQHPFKTGMERAEVLSNLRGDSNHFNAFNKVKSGRLSETFIKESDPNAVKLILWCLERNPSKRPSASEILESELLPRKIEIEENYLQEALKIITNNQSER